MSKGAISGAALEQCNCFALRKAARRVTQMYDAALAETGMRSTQYMILASLRDSGSISIHELGRLMAMDRTTVGKNLKPLAREGLLNTLTPRNDRRQRRVALTSKGAKVLERAGLLWERAQSTFREEHGAVFAKQLRSMLDKVAYAEVEPYASSTT